MAKYEYREDGLYWQDGKRAGKRVGRIKRDRYGKPYRQFKNCGKHFYEHREVWRLFNGEICKGMVIDHIDGDSTNNAICNLRCVTPTDNNRAKMRRGRGSKSGHTGVTWCKAGKKWKAHIEVNGRHKNLGLYACVTAAAIARARANLAHGFDSIHGKAMPYE